MLKTLFEGSSVCDSMSTGVPTAMFPFAMQFVLLDPLFSVHERLYLVCLSSFLAWMWWVNIESGSVPTRNARSLVDPCVVIYEFDAALTVLMARSAPVCLVIDLARILCAAATNALQV